MTDRDDRRRPAADVRTDEEILQDFRRTAEPRHFEELALRHQAFLHRLAASVLGPDHLTEAADLVQDVLWQAFRAQSSFRGTSRFSTWLFRLTYNAAIGRLRRIGTERRRFGRLRIAAEASAKECQVYRSRDQGSRDEDPGATLRAAVSALPVSYRTIIRLFYWQRLSVREIADLLGMEPNTVKSYLHRARLKLRRHLEKDVAREEAL